MTETTLMTEETEPMTVALPETGAAIVLVSDAEEELLRTFTFKISESSSHGEHLVSSPYVEQNWLTFIGPTALLVARKMVQVLSSPQDTLGSARSKEWALDLGVSIYDFLCSCERLVRWGFAAWDPVKGELVLKKRWHDVPPVILTPKHRAALMALGDEPLARTVPS